MYVPGLMQSGMTDTITAAYGFRADGTIMDGMITADTKDGVAEQQDGMAADTVAIEAGTDTAADMAEAEDIK